MSPISGTAPGRISRSSSISVQVSLPIPWHAASRSRHGLVGRVVPGCDQLGTVEVLLRRVVPEPVLARLVALDDRVPGVSGMVAGVLRRGRVTATDVATTRATA